MLCIVLFLSITSTVKCAHLQRATEGPFVEFLLLLERTVYCVIDSGMRTDVIVI